MVEQSVSFGCKFSVNLYFDAEQVLHHHRLTNNKDNYLISLENYIKLVDINICEENGFYKNPSQAAMCYCPI